VTSASDPSRPRSVTSAFHSHTPRIQSKPKTLSRQKKSDAMQQQQQQQHGNMNVKFGNEISVSIKDRKFL
jgi:hypothetical protein